MSLNEPVNSSTVIGSLSSTLQHSLNISSTSAEILVSILIFIVIGVIGCVSYFIISKYANKWVEKTATTLGDEITATIKVIMVILSIILIIQFALSPLSFLEPYSNWLDSLFLIIRVILVAYAVSKTVNIFIDGIADRTPQEQRKKRKHSTFILKRVLTAVVFIIAGIIILYLLEFTGAWETTLAGLGIGGIVIGIAFQSTLSDFFSALTIYWDHPFEIGDIIFIGEHGGTVKNIGMLTTRIQLLQGEELVISNREITSAYVRNFKKLQKRRIVFSLGVTYDTPNETLRKIPPMLIDIIKNIKGASPQFVNFNEFGEYGLKFFISYFVNSSDYGKYLEVQQEINLAIKEAFERECIEIAHLKNIAYIKR